MSPYNRLWLVIVGILLAGFINTISAILYPYESESRQVRDLSGRWKFLADFSFDRNASFRDRWWEGPLSNYGETLDMAVPSSYNDITQDESLRDFMGWVW